MKSGIYIITCIINSKIYVGRSKDYKSRLQQHKRELVKNIHYNIYLQSAVNKYGIENFTFELLEEHEEDFLPSMENYWCNLLNSHNRDYGYNIDPTSPFGKIANAEETKKRISRKKTEEERLKISIGNKGKKLSRESIEKTRNKTIGLRRTEEQKERIKNGVKNGKKPAFSKERLEKLSKSLKERGWSKESLEKRSKTRSIPIIGKNLLTGKTKEYMSQRIAAKELNICYKLINANIKKKIKTCKNYIFFYKENFENNGIVELQEFK